VSVDAHGSPNGVVDIVIVNWNSGDQLRDCLASITRHGGETVSCVIVVDNGSTDGSADIATRDDRLLIVETGRNLGFAAACNLGATHGSANFVLFLNPDAQLLPGSLQLALQFLESDAGKRAGVAGIQLRGDDHLPQRHCTRLPSWRTFAGQSLGLSGIMPRIFPPLFMVDFDHLRTRQVDHVIGAFYVIRRHLFEELNGFDERYFVYFEDLDLSARVAGAGWEIWYVAEAVAYHRGGGTSEQVKAHRLFYSLRSRILYAFKHFANREAWLTTSVILLAEPLARTARALVRASPTELFDSLRGYRMLLSDLPRTLRVSRAANVRDLHDGAA
jgi:N-acetylglucosaminyl-diphospho-decaprenol L-rhamnosyltransferase